MAAVRLGFSFEDGSFFNCGVNKAYWERLKSGEEGNFYVQSLAGQLASENGLTLSSPNLIEVREGGFHPGANLELGVLYDNNFIPDPPARSAPGPSPAQSPPDHPATGTRCPSSPSPTPSGSSLNSFEDDENSGESQSDGWPHSAVLLLLETFRVKRHLFQRPTVKKMEVWHQIAAVMAQKGWTFSVQTCLKKWDNLRNRYKIITDRHKATGRSRTTWAYLKVMADILDGDPSVTPPVTVSSLSGARERPTITTRTVTGNASSERSPSPPRSSTSPTVHLRDVSSPVSHIRRSASGTSPQISRKRKREEAPDWLNKMNDRTNQAMDRLISVVEEKNRLLAQLLEKL